MAWRSTRNGHLADSGGSALIPGHCRRCRDIVSGLRGGCLAVSDDTHGIALSRVRRRLGRAGRGDIHLLFGDDRRNLGAGHLLGIGQEGRYPREGLFFLGIKHVEDRADEQRMRGLFPMRAALERAFGINENIGDEEEILLKMAVSKGGYLQEKRVIARKNDEATERSELMITIEGKLE